MPMRFVSTLIISFAFAGSALAFDLTNLSGEERAALRDEIREFLLAEPEILVEMVALVEQQRRAEASRTDAERLDIYHGEIYEDANSWIGGNPDGDVTIVEFIDYNCSYCRRAFKVVSAYLEADSDARLIIKEFPILGPDSMAAAQFAVSVLSLYGPKEYKIVHEAMLGHDHVVNLDFIIELIDENGLDLNAVMEAMDSEEVKEVIASSMKLAQGLNITGTPGFVIGDSILPGFLSEEQLADQVAAARVSDDG